MVARAMSIFAGICLAARADAAPVVAESLKPTKPWVLDYAETQCTASRTYGASSNERAFVIRQAPYGETYELLIAREHAGPRYASGMEGTVDFGGGPIKSSMLRYSGKDRSIEIYQYRISASEMARARSASSVVFKSMGRLDLTLSLASMAPLLDGLDKCIANLRRHWNMDMQSSPIVTPGQGDVRRLFKSTDYPEEAIVKGQGGSVRFILLIDEAGTVAGCHVIEPSGVAVLDTMGCQVIRKRAKFKPALDASGKPVRSSFVTPPVRWTMTRD